MKKFIFLFVMTGLISLDATSYLKPKEREFKEDQWGGYVYADFNYSALSELLPYRFTTSEVQYIDESSDAIKPGFTLGIGAYTPYDNWNFFAEYTFLWFDSDLNRVRIENITTGNIPWVTNGLGSTTFPQYVNGSAEWRMQYNDVIISLKRNYKLTKGISCLLENGVRAIVSKQTLDFTDNLTLLTLAIKNQQKFIGVGWRLALDTRWILGRGIFLYSDLDVSLLSSHWNIQRENMFNTIHKGRINGLQPIFGSNVGIGWRTFINGMQKKDEYQFSLMIGGDTTCLFDHARFFRFGGDLQHGGSLSIYGLKLRAALSF